MKKPTKEEIREAVEYVFRNSKPPKTERQITFYSYCKGVNGIVRRGGVSMNLCEHPECVNCRNIEKEFIKQVGNYGK